LPILRYKCQNFQTRFSPVFGKTDSAKPLSGDDFQNQDWVDLVECKWNIDLGQDDSFDLVVKEEQVREIEYIKNLEKPIVIAAKEIDHEVEEYDELVDDYRATPHSDLTNL
jgi:hypothetical protein